MKLAIMQPYFFPYIGYFQLLSSVDKFIFLDDVNFIKKGWINRNRILLNGAPHTFTVPLEKASMLKKINEISISKNAGDWKRKLSKKIENTYHKAPHFNNGMQVFEHTISADCKTISDLAKESVYQVARYLEINTDICPSSTGFESALKGKDRILFICKSENASEYHNLPGGRSLYSPSEFEANGVSLSFISPAVDPYPQQAAKFIDGLSVLDLLMNLSKQEVQNRLSHFKKESLNENI